MLFLKRHSASRDFLGFKFGILFECQTINNLQIQIKMIKILYKYGFLISCFLVVNMVIGQNLDIERNISALDFQIDSILTNSSKKPINDFRSLPQTTAHYFALKTDDPEALIAYLNNITDIREAIKKYPNLEVDLDLLLVRNRFVDYEENEQVEFRTYEIGQGQYHVVTLPFQEKWISNDSKIIYRIYKAGKYNDKTRVIGFFILENFITYNIPSKYGNYISYVDLLIDPEFKLFDGNKSVETNGLQSIAVFDSLTSYYARVTNKPKYDENKYEEYLQALGKWTGKRVQFADSLYQNDLIFKRMLLKALAFAKEQKVSNADLEFFTAQLLSKREGLKLMRGNPQIGDCSFDNGPRVQLLEMARISAEIPDWNVFITSSMDLLNDYSDRVANSNIASNARSTYINVLEKLNLDISRLLIGSSFRIENAGKGHYFAAGNKVGQAFANASIESQARFKRELEAILKSDSIDAFNKLHFYNIYRNYGYFTADSIEKGIINNDIAQIVPYLPYCISSRIKDPNKQLKDLLIREKDELNDYNITESTIANILSYSFNGDCWTATLAEKDNSKKIYYDLTMSMEGSLTPLSNFLEKKNQMVKRILRNDFLMKLMGKGVVNEIYLNFTTNKSFADYKGQVTTEIPDSVMDRINLDDALSIYTTMADGGYLRWIITSDDKLVLLEIYKGINILNYGFEDLVTKTEDGFLENTYYSFRVFDSSGKMLF